MKAAQVSEERRRSGDKGLAPAAAEAAKATSRTFWDWAEKRKISAHAVMGVCLWLTIRVVEWAMDLPYDNKGYDGTHIAAMQAGVLGPWGLMQGAMFKFYIDLMKSNGVTQ